VKKKRERKESKTAKIRALAGNDPRTSESKSPPYRLSCDGLATSDWQKNIYIAIVITTVENRKIGESVIFRHNKHLNFYRSINMWKLILENFFNYKITETWQKPRTCWIRELHHFKHKCFQSFPEKCSGFGVLKDARQAIPGLRCKTANRLADGYS
jgi:hypothetical protein